MARGKHWTGVLMAARGRARPFGRCQQQTVAAVVIEAANDVFRSSKTIA